MLLDELEVRRSAMTYVSECSASSGGVVTRTQLEAFAYQGEQLKLIDQGRGIRNPRQLEGTLSILSSLAGPYMDVATADGLWRYAYRNGPAQGSDNRKLRRAYELGLPIILLQKIADAVFVPTFPVYVVDDVPEDRYFEIAVDESLRFVRREDSLDVREYAQRLTRLRLHQPVFRARVLRAYAVACAICRLRHVDLLDAAHILADGEGGQPVVPNGLALCKIHHAAYDRGDSRHRGVPESPGRAGSVAAVSVRTLFVRLDVGQRPTRRTAMSIAQRHEVGAARSIYARETARAQQGGRR